MNRILRSQLPPNPRDLAVFDTTTGSSPGRTRWSNFSKWGIAIMMVLSSFMANAQMNYSYNFVPTGTSGWTGNGTRSTNVACQTTASIRYNLYGSFNTMNFVSPALVSQGQLVTMTYFTKCVLYSPTSTAAGASTLNTQVQWATSTAGPWNNVGPLEPNTTITTCTQRTVTFTPSAGTIYVRFSSSLVNAAADVYLYLDDIVITAPAPPTCSGMPNSPTAALTGSASICAGATKSMTASGITTDLGITNQWMVSNTPGGPYAPVSGGTGATTASYTSAALTAGTYYYVLQSTCTSTSDVATSNELTLTVNALPTIVISSPNGGAFCGVQTMTASGASTYTWAPASSLSSNTGSSVNFIGTADATITATGTDANGCVGSVAQAVTFTSPESITMTSSVPNFCGTGGDATITASSNAAYTYVFDALDGAILSNATANTVDAAISSTSAIRVTGTDASTGCAAQAVASVGVYPLPSATVTTTASGVCPGTPATINSGLSAGNFTVSSIPHVTYNAPASAGVLMNNGVAVTPLGGGTMDDGGWGGIPIGFSFNFFGNNFTTIGAGTNGVLMFGNIPAFGTNDGELGDYTFAGPPYFPNAANAGNVIALLGV